MANQTEQIAASQQRQLIPREWQREFADWSNDTLRSFIADPVVDPRLRAYARYELDYRRAFDVLMVEDPITGLVTQLETDADLEAFDAAKARVGERVKAELEKRGTDMTKGEKA